MSLDLSAVGINTTAFQSMFKNTAGRINSFELTYPETVDDGVASAPLQGFFQGSTAIRNIKVKGLKYATARVDTNNTGFGGGANFWIAGATNLETIEWPDLEEIGLNTSQSYGRLPLLHKDNKGARCYCPKLTTMRWYSG